MPTVRAVVVPVVQFRRAPHQARRATVVPLQQLVRLVRAVRVATAATPSALPPQPVHQVVAQVVVLKSRRAALTAVVVVVAAVVPRSLVDTTVAGAVEQVVQAAVVQPQVVPAQTAEPDLRNNRSRHDAVSGRN
jgi:hypothetical protein